MKAIKSLPIVTIKDQRDDSYMKLIPITYVETALEGILLVVLGNYTCQNVIDEVNRLLDELKNAQREPTND